MRLYFLMFITAVCSLFLLSVQNGHFFFCVFRTSTKKAWRRNKRGREKRRKIIKKKFQRLPPRAALSRAPSPPNFLIIIWIVSVASIFYLGRCKPKYVSRPIYRAWFYPEDWKLAIAIATIVRIILHRLTGIFPYDRLNIYRDHPDHCLKNKFNHCRQCAAESAHVPN